MPGPMYQSAYASGSTLTLVFDQPLDTTHPPALSAFQVQVNGSVIPLDAVAINSVQHTVTLSFPTVTLVSGDLVTFNYYDPTNGNDTYAIQALDGTDAPSEFTSVYATAAGPSAPATPALGASSDTGTLGDNITSITTPTITGTAVAGATVKLYDSDGTTLLGTTMADGSGNWSITSSTLAEGAHSLKVTQTDSSNNTSALSNPLGLTIDTTPPQVPTPPVLTALSDSGTPGDGLTNVTTPTLVGVADPGSTVTLYDTDGTTVLGTAVTNVVGIYSITSSALGEGTHTFTAKATDAAGNVSAASSPIDITIDVTPPVVPTPPVLTVLSDSGVPGDGLTNVTTPTVDGLALPGSTVTLYDTDGTTVLGTATADGSGNYSITSSALGQGSHSLTVKAADPAGNVSAASTALSLTIDTTPPPMASAPILAVPSDSGTIGDGLTNVATPTVFGVTVPGTTVTLYDTDGTTVLGTTTADVVGVYSITSSALQDGTHTLSVRASDAAGNISLASPVLSLTVDTTPPDAPSTAPILAPPSDTGTLGDDITAAVTPIITGVAAPGSHLELYDTDGTTLLGTAIANESGVYSLTSALLSAGPHSLTVKAIDPAGNVSAGSPPLALGIYPGPVAPSSVPVLAAASDGGALGDGLTNVATPTLTGTALAGSTVTLYEDETPLGTAAVGLDGTWSFTSGALADGLHQITTSVTDPAGNVSPLSQPFALTIDTTPAEMTATLLNDTGSSATDRITADATLTGTGDPNALVTISEGGTTNGTTVADAQGNWTYTPDGLAVGVHTLVASETDAAGNTSTAQVGFRLDPESAMAPSDTMPINATSVGMARFFDTVSGTQFYTSSQSEYNAVLATRPDLKLETNDLTALNPQSVATDPDAVPVFRFFDTQFGTHFFTASTEERDSVMASRPDLKLEGVGFFEHATQQAGDSAVYRFFDTTNGTHFYTTSDTERTSILADRPDLKDEGIGFYAPKTT